MRKRLSDIAMATRFSLAEAPPESTGTPDDARTREIVAAAYALLEEEGLEGLTIRAVLARTGLARRALYERFAGKDDLVLAVFEQTLKRAAAWFAAEAARLPGPMEQLRFIVTGIVLGRMGVAPDQDPVPSDRRSAALSREHLRLAESRPVELQAALDPLLALMESIIARGMAEGVFRQADAALQARLAYNLLSTTIHTELLTHEGAVPDREARRALAGHIWDFCRCAVAAGS